VTTSGSRPSEPNSAFSARSQATRRGLSAICDLLLLLLDESAEALDRLPRVLGRDARAVAVVAARAGGGEIRGLPEQVRRLRARSTTASWRASGRTSSRSSTIGASVSATDLSLRRSRASGPRS
jgi:hypothetical protein